ncbi:GGDEF domain-containing protein [Mycobacterium sp. EPa45]|uniref:GGDEF domain-containing protein n=1 Tax=Mycobacterium sp. EPa45 TaxID=1545728 RepID=UPI000641DF99|nr:GGDEF domain-containing protein [Mycobacterium sp. EPa45]AKK30099.1 hypothetical protein AB431_00215 [Mycobacterium sp. EPa45]
MDADVADGQHAAALHTRVFHSLDEQIAIIDEAGDIVDVNEAWIQSGVDGGLPHGWIWIGRSYLDVLSVAGAAGDASAAGAIDGITKVFHAQDKSPFDLEYPCDAPAGSRWFLMRATKLRGIGGCLVAIIHIDITRRKFAEERAAFLAMHDELTGLPNRRYLAMVLADPLRNGAAAGSPTGLIMIDIDNFKEYNDALGHPAGDRCLSRVGEVLQTFARTTGGVPVRLGGDEFAFLLPNTNLAEVRRVAADILKALNALNNGGEREPTVNASIGVAAITADDLDDHELLLREADDALYRAKHAGGNRIALAEWHSRDGDSPRR